MKIAVIPARGGSKRFPRKNAHEFLGKPLVAHAIDAARESKLFEKIVVSTEDAEIASIARRYKATVVERPKELATDNTNVPQVCLHVLKVLRDNVDIIGILLPTSPLRTVADLQKSMKTFVTSGADYLMSITDYHHSVFGAMTMDRKGFLRRYFGNEFITQDQNNPKVYVHDGTVILARARQFVKDKTYYGKRMVGYYIPSERAVDVNHRRDLELAEFLRKSGRAISIGGQTVGTGHRCFIVFEAGPTVFDLESGKKLCSAAAEAGADAIKFQIMDVDRLMGDRTVKFTYGTENKNKTELLYDILKRRELKARDWKELKSYCDSLNLRFFATAMFPREIDLLKDMGACAVKIAAADINHLYLIEYAARSGLPVILDARGSLDEINAAVSACRNARNHQIMIMHCPPGYPAEDNDVGLSVLGFLKKRFQCPIGYSDHSTDALMDYASIGFGADCIEKTITLNRKIMSAEHYMSLEPHELRSFVENIRRIEKAIGRPKDAFGLAPSLAARRSLAAKAHLKKGHRLAIEDMDFKRPGYGISAEKYTQYIGKVLRIDIEKDAFFSEDMF